MSLNLKLWGSVLVVFRNGTTENLRTLSAKTKEILATLDNSRTITLQPNRFAPESVTLEQLSLWNETQIPSAGRINAPSQWFAKGSHFYPVSRRKKEE